MSEGGEEGVCAGDEVVAASEVRRFDERVRTGAPLNRKTREIEILKEALERATVGSQRSSSASGMILTFGTQSISVMPAERGHPGRHPLGRRERKDGNHLFASYH
jgi:hypothetical protein